MNIFTRNTNKCLLRLNCKILKLNNQIVCSCLLIRAFSLTLKSPVSNTIHTTIFKTIEFIDSHHLITQKKKKNLY